MKVGAHLPLIDFHGALGEYVDVARDGGYAAIAANDHLVFQRPWLDGLVALSSVLERSGDLTLATTVALPVIRGPVALAKTAAALQALSGGRFVLGVGPGSSPADYDAVGLPFDERWARFDKAVVTLRSELAEVPTPIPIWVGSWGSPAGLRRVARLGDGWLASSYNTTPDRIAAGRDTLPAGFPIALASTWTYLTDSKTGARSRLDALATMLNRDPDELFDRVLIGDVEHCAARLARFADAGVDTTFIWPLGDHVAQLRRFASEVVPRLS
jgi:alkanesulfonate monooxygenase SsuD/methylene tetrahydromethanopterin reductase-like flavin-dependent oxidoreductase (luciferase family)